MSAPLLIGGLPAVTLHAPRPPGVARRQPQFTSAVVLPGRGAMVLQLKASTPDGEEFDVIAGSALDDARLAMNGGPADRHGNASFLTGAAILVPYANRIRGKRSERDAITTTIAGRPVRLPANGGGKRAGAERYAQHGLILDRRVDAFTHAHVDGQQRFSASLAARDFGVGWPSSVDIAFEITMRADAFSLGVTVANVGDEPCPIGIGWHPYFALPSAQRAQSRLCVPARKRLIVNDYDEVLPTGAIVPATGAYGFAAAGGKALGELYIDDCFVDLQKTLEGHTVCEIVDPEASYGLRVIATSREVSAVQVYAPPDRPYVALEPQFNWADPYGTQWPAGTDTGMVLLRAGHRVSYVVRLEMFTPRDAPGAGAGFVE